MCERYDARVGIRGLLRIPGIKTSDEQGSRPRESQYGDRLGQDVSSIVSHG